MDEKLDKAAKRAQKQQEKFQAKQEKLEKQSQKQIQKLKLKQQKMEQSRQQKLKKQEANIKKKQEKQVKKEQKKDPVKRQEAKQAALAKKKQQKEKAIQKKLKQRLKNQKKREQNKARKQEQKQQRKDPAWQASEKEKKNKEKAAAQQKKQAQKQKAQLKKQKDKQKKILMKQKKQEKLAKEKALKKDPAWRQQEKERKAQAKLAAQTKKQKDKQKKAEAKLAKAANATPKTPMSRKKKLILLVAILCFLGIVAGTITFFLLNPSPQSVTEKYLATFVQGDFEQMNRYCESEFKVISDKIINDEAYQPIEDILRTKLTELEYTLGEEIIDGDTAVISVDFITYDLGSAIQRALVSYRKDYLVKFVSGKYEDAIFEEALISYLTEAVTGAEKTHQETIEIHLQKVNGQWRLSSLYRENRPLGKILSGCIFEE